MGFLVSARDDIDNVTPRVFQTAALFAFPRILKLHPCQPSAVLVALSRAGALPGIGGDVVMVAAGR